MQGASERAPLRVLNKEAVRAIRAGAPNGGGNHLLATSIPEELDHRCHEGHDNEAANDAHERQRCWRSLVVDDKKSRAVGAKHRLLKSSRGFRW